MHFVQLCATWSLVCRTHRRYESEVGLSRVWDLYVWCGKSFSVSCVYISYCMLRCCVVLLLPANCCHLLLLFLAWWQGHFCSLWGIHVYIALPPFFPSSSAMLLFLLLLLLYLLLLLLLLSYSYFTISITCSITSCFVQQMNKIKLYIHHTDVSLLVSVLIFCLLPQCRTSLWGPFFVYDRGIILGCWRAHLVVSLLLRTSKLVPSFWGSSPSLGSGVAE